MIKGSTPKPTHVYIGRRPCGCVVAVRSDTGDRSTAKDVADFIRAGDTVERVTLEAFREMHLGHTCGKAKPAQKRMAI